MAYGIKREPHVVSTVTETDAIRIYDRNINMEGQTDVGALSDYVVSQVPPGGTGKATLAKVWLSDYADLPTAVAAIGSTNAMLAIDADTTLSADLEIPKNISVDMGGASLITIASGYTLVLQGPFVAPKRQVFDYADATSAVLFESIKDPPTYSYSYGLGQVTRDVYPEWWHTGALAGGEDWAIYINRAAAALAYSGPPYFYGGRILLGCNRYDIFTGIQLLNSGIGLIGQSAATTVIRSRGAITSLAGGPNSGYHEIKNISFDGNGGIGTIGIEMEELSRSKVELCSFYNFSNSGMLFRDGAFYSSVDTCRFDTAGASQAGLRLEENGNGNSFNNVTFGSTAAGGTGLVLGNAADSNGPNQNVFVCATFESIVGTGLEVLKCGTNTFIGPRFEGNTTGWTAANTSSIQGLNIYAAHYAGAGQTNYVNRAPLVNYVGFGQGDMQEKSAGISDKAIRQLVPNCLLEHWDGAVMGGDWVGIDGTDWADTSYTQQANSGMTGGIGTYSVKAGDATDGNQIGVASPIIPVPGGGKITFNMRWTQEDANSLSRFAIRYYDADGADISSALLDDPVGAGALGGGTAGFAWNAPYAGYINGSDQVVDTAKTFQDTVITLDIDTTVRGIRIGIVSVKPGAADYVYVDSIQIYEGAGHETVQPQYARALLDTGEQTMFSALTVKGGVSTKVASTDTANPPTQAELVTAFGAAATSGAGFIGVLDDNGGGANEYLVFSDGTNYWYVAATVGA